MLSVYQWTRDESVLDNTLRERKLLAYGVMPFASSTVVHTQPASTGPIRRLNTPIDPLDPRQLPNFRMTQPGGVGTQGMGNAHEGHYHRMTLPDGTPWRTHKDYLTGTRRLNAMPAPGSEYETRQSGGGSVAGTRGLGQHAPYFSEYAGSHGGGAVALRGTGLGIAAKVVTKAKDLIGPAAKLLASFGAGLGLSYGASEMLNGKEYKDLYTDPEDFRLALRATKELLLQLQCAFGGAQPNQPYGCAEPGWFEDLDESTCICPGGTPQTCKLEGETLEQWRSMRDGFSRFYGENAPSWVDELVYDIPFADWGEVSPVIIEGFRSRITEILIWYITLPEGCKDERLEQLLAAYAYNKTAEEQFQTDLELQRRALEVERKKQDVPEAGWVKGARWIGITAVAATVLVLGVTLFKK
jgi:hypothetical protein